MPQQTERPEQPENAGFCPCCQARRVRPDLPCDNCVRIDGLKRRIAALEKREKEGGTSKCD